MDRMRLVKRFAVTLVGAALLVVGAALMVLPGPGILVIVAGLAVLATEFVWARALLDRAKDQALKVQQAAVASPLRTAGSLVFAIGLFAVGALMWVISDVAWPAFDSTLDGFWGRITGGVIIVTSVILITTTVLTIKAARGEPTTYTSGEWNDA